MAVETLQGTEEERSAQQLIGEANAVLAERRADIPQNFVSRLFAHAAPEDLIGYEPRELAALAEESWSDLAIRKTGAPKIHFDPAPVVPGCERLKNISVVEIVNDDMPFLVDSVMSVLTAQGLHIRLVVHPIFSVARDPSGKLQQLKPDNAPSDNTLRESFIHVHVERVDDAIRRTEIVQSLEQSLGDVRLAVQDWKLILARVGEVIASLKSNPSPLPPEESTEAIAFLEWLVANNFTFLGVREYTLTGAGELEAKPSTGLGVLRERGGPEVMRGKSASLMAREIQTFFNEPKALLITKANERSRVHRPVFMDYVGVKRFDAAGKAIGEFRIVGLFTSTAYTGSTRTIPYLRRKVEALLSRAGFTPGSHSGKSLVNTLESYPRDELFQINEDTLYRFALAILQLDERPRVRVLARRDRFDRFVSILVYIPRERADSAIVRSIGELLAEIYKGHVGGATVFVPEGPLVRIHFIIGRSEKKSPDPDRATLEYAVGAIVRSWADALAETLALAHAPAKARELLERYQRAFSASYRDHYSPATALADIKVLEGLSAERPLSVDFYPRDDSTRPCTGLKVWSHNRPIALSERVPVLENMGFRVVDERTYEIAPEGAGGIRIWMHDMLLERADGQTVDQGVLKGALEACFLMVMRGVAENDGYNALVLTAGLWWRDVALVRTISRYLRQIRVPFSQSYMWETLHNHAAIAAQILELFKLRFDPRLEATMQDRAAQEAAVVAAIETGLQAVQSLDEDRILRHFVNAVQSSLRTNFYQIDKDGLPKPLISIKFDSRKIDNLPLPRPLYEIFVYSPRVEGVHLRFGKVARGGIRWSDRPQDFRTEVLGLVKAQQVKNAVIVPVGAKGGFLPKLLPAGGPREAIQAEGVAAYKLFIGSLLDITDNLGPEGVIPPLNVVRHDDDDPYLVVAADKGTATFSDIANAISIEHDFWLGDAFASGGSAGYDHKKMAITARGAWEAVKRHFREMDVDIGKTPFTVAGVGDMSGDVFGNGMLREETIKLVAVFDHRDIFIDPDPDPKKSFAERARLFALPRSSWQDYDKSLISKGGGVFSRAGKEIALSPEMQAVLGLSAASATPFDVMKAILKSKVDLIFFGGIGTYIRAASETDEAAGDRANDAIRITGSDLRCKVIGEGANLGMTQRGRIEAALRGVRLNTDAIDNSAGVNTSDVEVNIKVALSPAMRSGALSFEDRNKLLTEMTDDVAGLVLRNNYLQTLALSLIERQGMDELGFLQRQMQTLEKRGLLDRAVEYLPDDMSLLDRRKRSEPLTRPELAVLLAYAKLTLYSDLLESEVPDDPYLERELGRYFPKLLAEYFPDALKTHRLRREIIATQITNSMINRGGPGLVVRLMDETGATPAAIATAFAAVRDSYAMPALNDEINALDNKVPGKLQLELYAAVQELLLDRLVWFLRNIDLSQGLAPIVEQYRGGIVAVGNALDEVLSEDASVARGVRIAELQVAGVPSALARHIAGLPALAAATNVVLISERAHKPVKDIAATFFAVNSFFRIDRIVEAANGIEVVDYFDRLAFDRALDSIEEAVRRITAEMTESGTAGQPAVEAWVAGRAVAVERIRSSIHEIAGAGLTLSKLSVAASLLGDLAKK